MIPDSVPPRDGLCGQKVSMDPPYGGFLFLGHTVFLRAVRLTEGNFSFIIEKVCLCERGGIGRRTGFRILRLVHKGSSPFARTRKRVRRKADFLYISFLQGYAIIGAGMKISVYKKREEIK